MFNRSDLDELLESEAQPAFSIYLPTHLATREVRQDPIRLRNLLTSAVQRLSVTRRRPEIHALLAPAEALLEDDDFWQHQKEGLAIFLAPALHRIHKLPIVVPEELLLGEHFHIRPLLPLLEDAGRFWLLTISAKSTRAYRGSRWSFGEAGGIDLPQGVAEIRGLTEYQEAQYASPTGRRGTLAHAQSFGESPDELRKTELIQLLRRVAAAFEAHLKADPAPVILAAHPEIQGNFREVAGWQEIQPDGIYENPEALGAGELHRRAYALVEQKVATARSASLDRLNALLQTAKATTKPEEIVKAARYARIDTLFLTGNEHLWGRYDESQDRIIAHGSAAEGDVDLLDYAALMTLRQGGSVTLIDKAALPPSGLAAAIMRY